MKGKGVLLLVTILLALACTSTASAAPASKVPFSATVVGGQSGSAERFWTDEEGVHVRGLPLIITIMGDVEGQIVGIMDANVNFDGFGDEQVKGVFTDGGGPIYRILLDLTLTDFGASITGTFVFIGVGSCKGIHITGTITAEDGGAAVLAGTKLTTHP